METTKFNIIFQLLIHIFVVYVAAEERYLVINILEITNFTVFSHKRDSRVSFVHLSIHQELSRSASVILKCLLNFVNIIVDQ